MRGAPAGAEDGRTEAGRTHALFALSDPHLSLAKPKPMDVFGPRWENHAERLADNWRRTVGAEDVVLVPGDISWAMRLADALPDLEWLAALPGRKILLKGNHDYWWPSSLAKLAALGIPTLHFIQNNHVLIDGTLAVGGSRLWDFPFAKWRPAPDAAGPPEPGGERRRLEDPEKIRAREMGRLAASLSSFPESAALKVVMTHFPPLGEDGQATPLTDSLGAAGIDYCVFGHVHSLGPNPRPGADQTLGRTRYLLAASDHLDHAPLRITDFTSSPG